MSKAVQQQLVQVIQKIKQIHQEFTGVQHTEAFEHVQLTVKHKIMEKTQMIDSRHEL